MVLVTLPSVPCGHLSEIGELINVRTVYKTVPKSPVALRSLFVFPKSESSCEIWFSPAPNLPDISTFWAFTYIGFQIENILGTYLASLVGPCKQCRSAKNNYGNLAWSIIISFTFTVADNLSKRDNIDFISENSLKARSGKHQFETPYKFD